MNRPRDLLGSAFLLLLLLCLLAYADSHTSMGTITCVVPPELEVTLNQDLIALLIDPDTSPIAQTLRALSVGTNNPPVAVGISLLHDSPSFSYRLTEHGVPPGAWREIPILPEVSWESLPDLGWTDCTLDLRSTAGPDLAAGVYQDDIQVLFQASGIIQAFFLHVETTVLPRSPVVVVGPDQTVDEGETVSFRGRFSDPDHGETYTIGWDFGDGATENGIMAPTHTYLDNGTYTATLTVTDSGGRAGESSLTITVDDLAPTAHVESDPPVFPLNRLIVEVGAEATFDASHSASSPDAIVLYEWDWDHIGLVFESSGDMGKTIGHVFEEAGDYTIAVRVTDDDGSTDIATLAVAVTPVQTVEVGLATPEVAGAGGAAVLGEVAIDEVYVHRQALSISQLHLVSHESAGAASAPVIYFPLDEGSGEYAFDEIDIQLGRTPVLAGALHQAEWIEGTVGMENQYALSLGQDGWVEVPANPRMDFPWNQDFTLELWVQTSDAASERLVIQRHGLDETALYGLSLCEGVPVFYISTAFDTYAIVKGSRSIADEVWHHVACMRSEGVLRLYIDGELADELGRGGCLTGAGRGNLSSEEPTFFGGLEGGNRTLGGLVDASYCIGETIEFQMQITDETETPVTGRTASLFLIHYGYGGEKLSSGLAGRLTYSPDSEEYTTALDTSTLGEGIYDFLVFMDGVLQHQLRVMLFQME